MPNELNGLFVLMWKHRKLILDVIVFQLDDGYSHGCQLPDEVHASSNWYIASRHLW